MADAVVLHLRLGEPVLLPAERSAGGLGGVAEPVELMERDAACLRIELVPRVRRKAGEDAPPPQEEEEKVA
jgi:hypothetical protein